MKIIKAYVLSFFIILSFISLEFFLKVIINMYNLNNKILIEISVNIIIIFILYKIYLKLLKYNDFKENLSFKAITYIIILFLIQITYPIILMLKTKTNYNVTLDFNFNDFVNVFLLNSLIPALNEEILFRGIIFNICLNKKIISISKHRKLLNILTILYSSFVFALLHFSNSIWTFNIHLIFGLVSSQIYYKYKNISINILLHFFNNLIISILGPLIFYYSIHL